MVERELIYADIYDELKRQDELWGEKRKLKFAIWYAILDEEKGECSTAILNDDWDNLYEELTQVAATCINWMISSDVPVGKPGLHQLIDSAAEIDMSVFLSANHAMRNLVLGKTIGELAGAVCSSNSIEILVWATIVAGFCVRWMETFEERPDG